MAGDCLKFGALIKYYRTQKRITQKELAKGICSISHLSKIENNSKEANKETIILLLKKLQIDFEEINEKEELIQKLLVDVHQKMNFYQKEEALAVFNKLSELENIVPYSVNIYFYELTKLRFLLFSGLLEKAEREIKILRKQKINFSQHEDYLFQYYNGILLIMKGEYIRADEVLNKLLDGKNSDIATGEFHYHRALVKSALQETGYAIHYGKQALQIFMHNHNFVRLLHTLMLLGINYTQSGIYEEAEECFRHLLRNGELLNDPQLLSQIYHNIGFLKKKMDNPEEALYFFQKSLSSQPVDSINNLVTMYCIGEIHYILKEEDEAELYFSKVLEMAKRIKSQKYQLLATYYLLSFTSIDEALRFLKEKVVPFLEDGNEHQDDLKNFYKLLSNHYLALGAYEEALSFYKKMS